MSIGPDRLYIDKNDAQLYDELEKQDSMFVQSSNHDKFLFAMSVGFITGAKVSPTSRIGYFLTKDMGPDDEAMIDAVAIYSDDKSVLVLEDKKKVFNIAEAYAHAGIKLLSNKASTHMIDGSFYKQIEKELYTLINDDTVGGNDKDTTS